MIPKNIHYCWYGNTEKDKKIKRYLSSWTLLTNEGYNIIEWNESNCNLQCNDYVKMAVKEKNWAFVSDYFRLKALYEFGGIYLDTDVEVYKSFDDLLKLKGFLGYMYDSLIGTAVLGFEKHNPFISMLLDLYDSAKWVEGTNNKFIIQLSDGNHICDSNNTLFTLAILDRYKNFKLNGKKQELTEFTIFPMKEFEIGTILGRTHCVHRCEASWKDQSFKRELFKTIKNIAKIIPFVHLDALIRRISYQLHIRKSPFYQRYKMDKTL